MKKAWLFLLLFICACGPNYSNGSRIGIVTKLSQKGIVWKSWEGEMLIALPTDVAGTTQPEKFAFTVDPSAVEKVQVAMNSGRRVELIYRQWWLKPPTQDTLYVIVDVKETK